MSVYYEYEEGLLEKIKRNVIPFVLIMFMMTALFTVLYVAFSHKFEYIYVIASLMISFIITMFIFDSNGSWP